MSAFIHALGWLAVGAALTLALTVVALLAAGVAQSWLHERAQRRTMARWGAAQRRMQRS